MVAENGCLCAIAADEITRLTAEVERLRAVLDILQAAMTAKKPIPLVFKKAITEARAALSGDKQ
jgi:predicted HAD superfamily phosphohydrolase YqeG